MTSPDISEGHGYQRYALVVLAAIIIGGFALPFAKPLDMTTAAPRAFFRPQPIPVMPVAIDQIEPVVERLIGGGAVIRRSSADQLGHTFASLAYDLDGLRAAGAAAPRLFIDNLPKGLKGMRDIKARKSLFFLTVLPMILRENERLTVDRQRIWRLRSDITMGRQPAPLDALWLAAQTQIYNVEPGDFDGLLLRVDAIPVSLALAQAAEESGWGTSRFARLGNSLFGQWTWTGKGMVPGKRAAGRSYKVLSFDTLSASVQAYMRNLNTHKAYKKLRLLRTAMRRAGQPVRGYHLAAGLDKYSQRGAKYIESLRGIMRVNKLPALDFVRLRATSKTA